VLFDPSKIMEDKISWRLREALFLGVSAKLRQDKCQKCQDMNDVAVSIPLYDLYLGFAKPKEAKIIPEDARRRACCHLG
jgi:hypothetical protein